MFNIRFYQVWDLGTSKCINSLYPDKVENHRYNLPIQNVDISSDQSTLIATNSRGTVYVWDPADTTNFKPKVKFQAHSKLSYLLKARISPDCQSLVTTSSDTTVKLWDMKTWKCSSVLRSHTKWYVRMRCGDFTIILQIIRRMIVRCSAVL